MPTKDAQLSTASKVITTDSSGNLVSTIGYGTSGNSVLLQTTSDGKLPALSAENLTSLPSAVSRSKWEGLAQPGNPGTAATVLEAALTTTLTGTLSVSSWAARPYTRLTTGSAANNGATAFSLTTVTRTEALPDVQFTVKLVDTTGVRFWAGIFSNSAPYGAADPASYHLAAFRFDTAAGDTTFLACTKDGTTLGTTNTTITPDTNEVLLRVKVVSTTSIEFYINGTIRATRTANLPTSTTGLFVGVAQGNGGGGGTKAMEWARTHLYQGS